MKFVAGENGRNPEKASSTTKPTWSDGDANSGRKRWETSDKSLAPQSRLSREIQMKCIDALLSHLLRFQESNL